VRTCSARASASEIEIRKGRRGAYICGEETAIFESIEGNRGEPRNKPRFPVVEGLFGKPTVVNTSRRLVRTSRHRAALRPGSRDGHRVSTGPKLFCLSGHVERPGVYEVPSARRCASCCELAAASGGAGLMRPDGGGAGGFLRPTSSTSAHFEGAREAKTTLGSGSSSCSTRRRPAAHAERIAAFFATSPCGQCVPVPRRHGAPAGVSRRADLGQDDRRTERELAVIAEVGQCMRDASIAASARRRRARSSPRSAPRSLLVSRPVARPRRMIELEIDGRSVRVFEGETILGACRRLGIDTPTLCYGDTLEPANAVPGLRRRGRRLAVLAPACSRKAEEG
jgi:NADH:ubiquinone oxidoreductase subunit F (NADH-binding)